MLVIEIREPCNVEFSGRSAVIDPGVYLYIGSARGPGGALARVIRHLTSEKRVWWHIDRLLACPGSHVCGVVLINAGSCDCEAEISRLLRSQLSWVPGFGSSDKRHDISHLYKCNTNLVDCVEHTYELLERVACFEKAVYATLRDL